MNFLLSIIFACCSFAINAQNYQKAAQDHCNCFRSLDTSTSDLTKRLVIQAAEGASFQDSLKSQMQRLTIEEQTKFKKEFEKIASGLENENSQLSKCLYKLEDKYKDIYADDTGPKMKKLIEEIRNQNCHFLAAVMRMGMEYLAREDEEDK